MTWMALGLIVVVTWLAAAVVLSFGLGALVARNRGAAVATADATAPSSPRISINAA